jgi:hypothetical protein
MFQDWISANWLDLLQTVGVFVAVAELRANTKARKLANLFTLTDAHSRLWKSVGRDSRLKAILEPNRSMATHPLTLAEKEHLNRQILHVKLGYEALKNGLPVNPHAVNTDIREFFSLPAVASFWNEAKPYHDRKFVSLIDQNIAAASETDAGDMSRAV